MNILSTEAKEWINDAFEKGYSPEAMKWAMEDGAYLEEANISQELSEEVHFFLASLANRHIFDAMVTLYDFSENEIKTIKVAGWNEQEIMSKVDMIIDESNDLDIFYGRIVNFCAIK